MNNGSPVKFVSISKTDYDALTVKDPGTLYYVTTASGARIYVGSVEYSRNEPASDDTAGLIKTDAYNHISIGANGELVVDGRLGHSSTTTGMYAPPHLEPRLVSDGSLLITEGSGVYLGKKSLAVSTGTGLTLKTSAAAGATEYRVANTYENRIICAGLAGGAMALNESTAATNYARIVSATINGSSFVPDSSANSSTDIVVTVDKTVNPDGSATSVRPYGNQGDGGGFSNLYIGQLVGGVGGASIIVGQKNYSASGNACAIVGASVYNAGNGNAIFGRQHISRKNRSLLAGTGHDTTNGPSENVVAFGQWSSISSDTVFAIGNGTNATNRSNLFEIKSNGDIYVNGVKKL